MVACPTTHSLELETAAFQSSLWMARSCRVEDARRAIRREHQQVDAVRGRGTCRSAELGLHASRSWSVQGQVPGNPGALRFLLRRALTRPLQSQRPFMWQVARLRTGLDKTRRCDVSEPWAFRYHRRRGKIEWLLCLARAKMDYS